MLCHPKPLPGYCGLRGHANEVDLAFNLYGRIAVPFDSSMSLCHLSQAEEHQPREHARHPPDGKAQVSAGEISWKAQQVFETYSVYIVYVCISWMSANFK